MLPKNFSILRSQLKLKRMSRPALTRPVQTKSTINGRKGPDQRPTGRTSKMGINRATEPSHTEPSRAARGTNEPPTAATAAVPAAAAATGGTHRHRPVHYKRTSTV